MASQLSLSAAAAASSNAVRGCVDSFYEEVVLSYSEAAYHSHFRMSRNAMMASYF